MKMEKFYRDYIANCDLNPKKQLCNLVTQICKLKIFLCLFFLMPLLYTNVKAYDSTFSVSVPKNIEIDSNTKIGSYNVYVKGNIASGETAIISVTPSPDIILSNISKTNGSSKSDVSAQVSQDVKSWTYDDIMKGASTSGTITASNISAGDWIGSLNFNVKFEVNTMVVNVTNGEATYDGNATNGNAKVEVTSPSSGYTIKYGTTSEDCSLTDIPTYTNVGIYTIYYQVTATNYTTKTGSFTITINKANGSVTAPIAKSLAYTGQEQELIEAGSSTTGEIQYKLGDDGEYSTTIPTATDEGTYKVYYKVVGDSNHNNINEASVNVTIIPSISYSSWNTIQTACKNGLANEYFSVGDERTINLGSMNIISFEDDRTVESLDAQTATMVIGDISNDGKTLTMLFISYSTLAPSYYMNINVVGWASTSMRAWLNDSSSGGFYAALPSDLQSAIITHNSSYSETYDATSVSYCYDKIWLLSTKEVFGGGIATSAGSDTTYRENLAAFNAETQLAYFANGGDKIRYRSSTDVCWWGLRSFTCDVDYAFTGVDRDGSSGGTHVAISHCVFPAFCIG